MTRTPRSPEETRGHAPGGAAFAFCGALKPHPKVLIVDGDPATGRMLRVVLEGAGYRVLLGRNCSEGLAEAASGRPDAVVLELDLPDGDGFGFLAALRDWCEAPVLVLSGRAAVADKVRALDGGANDFVGKPFAPEELAARLRVLLRSEPPVSDGPLLVSGALRIDMATREMTVNGCALELTATEEAVLYILARHAGKLVPRERLIRSVWGTTGGGRLHDLQVHIARLRRKLAGHAGSGLVRGDGVAGYCLALVAETGCAVAQGPS